MKEVISESLVAVHTHTHTHYTFVKIGKTKIIHRNEKTVIKA